MERPSEAITHERATGPAPQRTLPAKSFAHLPVKETVAIVPEAVQRDPSLYERIGEERSVEVDLVPPQLFKREIVRPKCRHCLDRNRAPPLAPAPKRVVTGGLRFRGTDRLGADREVLRSPATLPARKDAGALGRTDLTAESMRLAGCSQRAARTSGQADETGLVAGRLRASRRDADPLQRPGSARRARPRKVGCVPSRAREAMPPSNGDCLADMKRASACSATTKACSSQTAIKVARRMCGIEWVGCWAHARRRFFEAAAEQPKTAARVLQLIGQLYALEHAWDEAAVGDRRASLRQEHFARPLSRLRRLVTALQARVLPKSGLGQACGYLLGHWQPLTAHLRHAHTRLDTNAVENAIRPIKVGAKNWLFIGHPDAGDRAAVICSLVVSCQRQGHNPHDYLHDLLRHLPAMTTADDLCPHLPSGGRRNR